MAKAASPIRLEADLMAAATRTGTLFKRSSAEQIEYWASIGRSVANILNPSTLLDITSGTSELVVKPVAFDNINPDAVFDTLEADRNTGSLSSSIAPTHSVRYQASSTHKGYLEQICPDGSINIGSFSEGVFTPKT